MPAAEALPRRLLRARSRQTREGDTPHYGKRNRQGQRDPLAIIHSLAFKKLQHPTVHSLCLASEFRSAARTLHRPSRDAVATVGTVLPKHGSRRQRRLRPHRIGGSRRQPRPLQLRDRPVNSHLHDARVKANGRDQDAEKDSEEKRGQEARRIRRHSSRVRNNPSKSATGDQYRNYSRDDRPDNAPEKYDNAPTERKTPPDHKECPTPVDT